ncbi:MAG TPA: hypothetical protein PKY10_16160 [Lentisphaeria bacterium]|nr:hypothetical protein [Lentisphaeria bacterium]
MPVPSAFRRTTDPGIFLSARMALRRRRQHLSRKPPEAIGAAALLEVRCLP